MIDTDILRDDNGADNTVAPTAVQTELPATVDLPQTAARPSLTTMVLPELRALAGEVGVKGTSGMRKNELIAAIQERQGQANGHRPNGETAAPAETPAVEAAAQTGVAETPAAETPAAETPSTDTTEAAPAQRRERRSASRAAGNPAQESTDDADAKSEPAAEAKADTRTEQRDGAKAEPRGDDKSDQRDGNKSDQRDGNKSDQRDGNQQRDGKQQRDGNTDRDSDDRDGDQQGGQNRDDDGEGRGGRRGRRFRDRRRRGERSGGEGNNGDAELREDDVVQPVAGILDVLDNYAFVRTSGYLAGPNDVYVSMNMVRKNGLRRGDHITGAVRIPKEGESSGQNPRQKFNPLVRLDTVNGGSVEDAKKRPDFSKLTPLYPNQRLRLETTNERLTTRVIDLIMPIGKGQRALIVSPPKAGKTTILQDIANAITRNNPECHLMVVLVDERPEEVTDMQRSVKGEVIASTFDRPPSDHTQAAELAIERAKRLVEQGKDVVVLLDSITRLGRAYNNASPASGRILSGGVDSTALYPPKRFLGAARNIEHGGSLTIVATAMVETGSTGDTVIFEEFKGTGNAELKLDRKIAERRVFPAVDVNPSGTRKDELLLSPDEFAIVHKLRRVLSGLDSHQAIDLLMSQLRKTKNNYEFLVQVSKTAPGSMDQD